MQLPNYRRTLISRCARLTALDHRPVFPQERRYAEAWWAERSRGPLSPTSPTGSEQPGPVGGSEGSGGLASGAPAEEAGPGDPLPRDVLHPVLAVLDARSLVHCARACRWWAESSAFHLQRARLSKAQVGVVSSA